MAQQQDNTNIDTNDEVLKQIEKEAVLSEVVPDELRKNDITQESADEDIYKKEEREEQLEGDEITPEEEEFMEGEEDESELGDCSNCGKTLTDSKDSLVSKEINKNRLWFCGKDCLQQFDA
ncbi:hypothetical protein J4206_01185 [Candidatus Woesearchaeota archaeon]|nr:hypothetical protein [Candidatus Woesearchaeota archaeon]